MSLTVITASPFPSNTYHAGSGPSDHDTITLNANGQIFVDGQGLSIGDVVYVKNEATLAHNGVYTVTTAGDGSHQAVINRNNGPALGDTAGPILSGIANLFSEWIFSQVPIVTSGVSNGAPCVMTRLFPTIMSSSLSGYYLSNNFSSPNTKTDISAGSSPDSTSSVVISGPSFTKDLSSSWSAGSGNGGLFSGSVAANTVYYVFVILKDADLSVDFGFDISVVGANVPGGYTYFRRIGSVLTDGSSNIVAFKGRSNFTPEQ